MLLNRSSFGPVNLGASAKVSDYSSVQVGSGGWTTWCDTVAGLMVQAEGDSGQKMPVSGVVLPAMTGLDTFVVLAQLFTPVARTIEVVSGQKLVSPKSGVSAEGEAGYAVATGITPQAYLGGRPTGFDQTDKDAIVAYDREVDGTVYTVSSGGPGVQFSADNVTHLRQLLDNFQAATIAGAEGILSCGVLVTNKMQGVNVAAFWTAVRRLALQIDVMQGVQATTDLQAIKNGLAGAKDATVQLGKDVATDAGTLGAQVAGYAGNVAGNAFAGFWKEAGPMALVVVAIVAYIAVR